MINNSSDFYIDTLYLSDCTSMVGDDAFIHEGLVATKCYDVGSIKDKSKIEEYISEIHRTFYYVPGLRPNAYIWTPYAPSFEKILNRLSGLDKTDSKFDRTRKTIVVFLTDGQPTEQGGKKNNYLLPAKMIREDYRVKICSIFFNSTLGGPPGAVQYEITTGMATLSEFSDTVFKAERSDLEEVFVQAINSVK